ncbi:MAG: hypothetical protein Q8R58_03930 [Sulfuricurvum sp.]|nr:hypothetical protein [Sulfuricurvum sp.]
MILTLHSIDKTFHINITADQFTHLRSPDISSNEIMAIASECEVDPILLAEYAADLKKSAKEMIEIDGSCDYSNHL